MGAGREDFCVSFTAGSLEEYRGVRQHHVQFLSDLDRYIQYQTPFENTMHPSTN